MAKTAEEKYIKLFRKGGKKARRRYLKTLKRLRKTEDIDTIMEFHRLTQYLPAKDCIKLHYRLYKEFIFLPGLLPTKHPWAVLARERLETIL